MRVAAGDGANVHTGVHKNCGDAVSPAALVAQFGALLRQLIDAGSPALPRQVRLDLAMLLVNAVEAKADR